MQSYLTSLAELFKLAAMYGDKQLSGMLAKLLELSLHPVAQLAHWEAIQGYADGVADSIVLQDITEYLQERVKQ